MTSVAQQKPLAPITIVTELLFRTLTYYGRVQYQHLVLNDILFLATPGGEMGLISSHRSDVQPPSR